MTRPATTRSLVATYGVALLVPVVLWAISEPLLAAGAVALVGGAYAVGWFGVRIVRRRARSAATARSGAARTQTVDSEP